jgi:hypothetical protein
MKYLWINKDTKSTSERRYTTSREQSDDSITSPASVMEIAIGKTCARSQVRANNIIQNDYWIGIGPIEITPWGRNKTTRRRKRDVGSRKQLWEMFRRFWKGAEDNWASRGEQDEVVKRPWEIASVKSGEGHRRRHFGRETFRIMIKENNLRVIGGRTGYSI